jgi:hypothetical protein
MSNHRLGSDGIVNGRNRIIFAIASRVFDAAFALQEWLPVAF